MSNTIDDAVGAEDDEEERWVSMGFKKEWKWCGLGRGKEQWATPLMVLWMMTKKCEYLWGQEGMKVGVNYKRV